jgi:hypothetical protein
MVNARASRIAVFMFSPPKLLTEKWSVTRRVSPFRPRETPIYCHPGKNQHGKRKARLLLSFIFDALQALKMAGLPAPREALYESAPP